MNSREKIKNIGLIVNELTEGGAQKVAADLSIFFSERDYSVYIFTNLSKQVSYKTKGNLVDFRIENLEEKEYLYGKLRELEALKETYEIEISISFMQTMNMLNLFSKKKDVVILTNHSVMSQRVYFNQNTTGWERELFRDYYQLSDAIVTPSLYCYEDWLKSFGNKNGRLVMINNPVQQFHKRKKDFGKTVLCVGRFHGIKQQWHILNAFRHVVDSIPNAKLLMLGDGELRFEYEKTVKKLDLEKNVEIVGFVNNIQRYLDESAVYVITSKSEAFSCATGEAMSAGIPVIFSESVGGIKEVANAFEMERIDGFNIGKCSIMTPEFNNEDTDGEKEKKMAEAIVYLLNNKKLNIEMGKNASEHSKSFSIEKIGEKWIELFENLPKEDYLSEIEEAKERYFSNKSTKKTGVLNNLKQKEYASIREEWNRKIQQEQTIEKYCMNNNYRRVVVYGFAEFGRRIVAELDNTNVEVIAVIDERCSELWKTTNVIDINESIPDCDVIICTPFLEFSSISKILEKKTTARIVSLKEVIDEL